MKLLTGEGDMWILTEEYNDYSQHGEYFVAAWLEKPTSEQLKEKFGDWYGEYSKETTVQFLLSGGCGQRK